MRVDLGDAQLIAGKEVSGKKRYVSDTLPSNNSNNGSPMVPESAPQEAGSEKPSGVSEGA